ncbi:hypothetical protein ABZT51_23335 [Streptomyces sp. NPDC005373]|uniref:hypothetical protein n=1 Tax=Streptomyces sp. NPDC005373 TaxID=3156879 RepID=UPI0033A42BB0
MALVLFAAPVALVTALVLRERRSERPLLDLTLPASRGFLLNTLAATLGMNAATLGMNAGHPRHEHGAARRGRRVAGHRPARGRAAPPYRAVRRRGPGPR